VVEQILSSIKNFEPGDLPSVLALDQEARRLAAERAAALATR
jgi:hypothetical protein